MSTKFYKYSSSSFPKKKRRQRSARKVNSNFQLRYSQNFLKSPKLVRKLLDMTSLRKGDLVYEIGPGKGIITKELARRRIRVVGIEKDEKLYKNLSYIFKENPNVRIKLGDFLECKLPREPYKVFSNIPYNITAEIISKLTSQDNPPQDAYLIIQKEAALKYAGSPYGKERQVSLLLKPWFRFKILYYLKRTDFYPVPSVESVLLQIKKRKIPLIPKDQAQLYRDFIVFSLNQWKLNLKKALKNIFTYEQFKRLSKNLRFNKDAKPTDLTFQQWLALFQYFLQGVEKQKKNLVKGAEKKLKRQQNRLQKIHRTRF